MTLRRAIFTISIAVCFTSAVGHADEVDVAYRDFLEQRYGLVFQRLLSYRLENEGTLRADFMLAVSACKLPDPDFKAFGGALLAVLPRWYNGLKPDRIETINNHRRDCPSYGLSEEDAVARLKGKTDVLGDHENLETSRSSSGKDDPLPFAPLTGRAVVIQPPPAQGGVVVQPPPGRGVAVEPQAGRGNVVPPPPVKRPMGPLLINRGFQGGTDYREARTPSAAECSTLCFQDDACVVMTYLVKEQTCYLKNGITTLVETGNMVSAVKQ